MVIAPLHPPGNPVPGSLVGKEETPLEKIKASDFTGFYSAFEALGSSMFAHILATKAQLSLWVGVRSTKEWMKSHDRSAGAGAWCWRGL